MVTHCDYDGSFAKFPTSCSVACYKTHKPTHEAQVNNPPVEHTPADKQVPDQKSTVRSRRLDKPRFADLEKDSELQQLLQRHPDLRRQLQNVYALMLEPDPDRSRGQGSYGGRGGGQRRWTRQKGEQEAQAMLRQLREREDPAIIEFLDLVTSKSELET